MIDQEQSERFFNDRLRPVLEEVESLRKEILEKGKRYKLLLSGFGILVFLYTYTHVQVWADTYIQKFVMSVILIILLVVGYMSIRPEMFLPRTERNRLYNLYKNGIIREIIRYVNKPFNYHPIFKTNIRLFDKSRIFEKKITEYKETFGIVGTLNGVETRISEIQLRTMLMVQFEGWFVDFDERYNLPDFMLCTKPMSVKNNAKLAAFEASTYHEVQVLSLKGNGVCPQAKTLAKVIKKHTVKNAKSISLSVLDGRVFLAIENDGLMFQISFRDDNQNYIGSYVDFAHAISVTNFMDELTKTLEHKKVAVS